VSVASAIFVALLPGLDMLLVAAAARLHRIRPVAAAVAGLPALASGRAGLALVKLMGRTFFMGGMTALPARFPGFLRIELVRGSALVRGSSSLRGNFTLLLLIHRSESAAAGVTFSICHHVYLMIGFPETPANTPPE